MTIGPGWNILLTAVEDFLRFRDGRITKIVTGNGGLIIMYKCEFDVQSIITAAETMAGIMCEECGKPASCHDIGEIKKTLCEKHLKECHDTRFANEVARQTKLSSVNSSGSSFQHVWTAKVGPFKK